MLGSSVFSGLPGVGARSADPRFVTLCRSNESIQRQAAKSVSTNKLERGKKGGRRPLHALSIFPPQSSFPPSVFFERDSN